jgi:hypothetical protein
MDRVAAAESLGERLLKAGDTVVPVDPYKGWLSRAWLQDEVINVDVLPAVIELPRRYVFRYAKIDVVATSANYAVRISDVKAMAVTSATGTVAPLPASTPEPLRRIDEVSIHTLRECMQTVFEDGPKRDRRLWIGDLRLQALTNYVTFRNFDLVKRCLFLFAGLPRENGLVALYHHVADAMLQCGLKTEALELIRGYWGGMVAAGADTFWEVYDPKSPLLSPYGNVLTNSYCHAWSCTPAYLLRKGALV